MQDEQTTDSRDSVAARYETLSYDREHFLDRARLASRYTIPYVMPEDNDDTSTMSFPTPYQSFGRDGVNNLASKLLLTLLPPNAAFFRFKVDEAFLAAMGQSDQLAKIKEGLALTERMVMEEINQLNLRPVASEALIHAIITGNGYLYLTPEGGVKFFGLDKFVDKKDPEGNLLEIITKETTTAQGIPKKYREFAFDMDPNDDGNKDDDVISIFTRVYKEDSTWKVEQEINQKIVMSSTYGKNMPWIPLEFYKVSGESYARGYVEGLLGDLISLEGLSKSIVEGSALAAKVTYFLRPSSYISKNKLASANNGDIIDGDREDVGALTLDKYADFRVALEQVRELSQRLAKAFLMRESVQRDAERVTATEIRMLVEELESGLGAVYSVFANSFQRPLVEVVIDRLKRKGQFPRELTESLKNGSVKLEIITGLEALGRGNELNALVQFLEISSKYLSPQEMVKYIKPSDLFSRLASSLNINKDGLVKSEEELQQEMQQAQQAAMRQQTAPIYAQGEVDQRKAQLEQQLGQGNG